MNVYGLYDNYGDLFQPVAELCNEIIFDREYLENPKNSNEGSYIGQFFAPVMMGGWEALSPTQDLIDSYPCKDGKSIKESPFYNPEDPFADRDPPSRLLCTVERVTNSRKDFQPEQYGRWQPYPYRI